jgi:para-nitrobenzyl esterase
MRFLLAFILSVVLPAFSFAGPRAAQDASGPVVKIDSGPVRGVTSDGLDIFKGIPYAQPPVGKLRWRPPQPVEPWSDIRSTADYGHDCMQMPFPGDAAPLQTTPSEDCLYLNVWAPANSAHKSLPVMVWIHGGGFVNGGSSPAVYSGAAFARKGVVFVSMNYRLGRFGFFAFPALRQEGDQMGNFGYMDQIAALKWVQANIAAFGGNPHKVTVFGESAGGGSVNMLMTSPLARGLFQQAMVESGGGRDTIMVPPSLDRPGPHGEPSALQAGMAFAELMGINGTDAAALEALRALPAEKIVNKINMASMFAQRNTYSGPMLDGYTAVKSAEDVYKAHKQARVPVVIGANSADIGFSFAKTFDELFAPFGKNAAKARAAFNPTGEAPLHAVAQNVAATQIMIEPARFVARVVAAGGQPAYQYRFSYVATAVRKKFPGAFHSSEIPYAFDTIRESMWSDFGKGITPEDLRIAGQMNDYWVNFAKTGNPNGSGLPKWPRMTAHGNELLNFTEQGPKGETDPWKTWLDLVEAIQP